MMKVKITKEGRRNEMKDSSDIGSGSGDIHEKEIECCEGNACCLRKTFAQPEWTDD